MFGILISTDESFKQTGFAWLFSLPFVTFAPFAVPKFLSRSRPPRPALRRSLHLSGLSDRAELPFKQGRTHLSGSFQQPITKLLSLTPPTKARLISPSCAIRSIFLKAHFGDCSLLPAVIVDYQQSRHSIGRPQSSLSTVHVSLQPHFPQAFPVGPRKQRTKHERPHFVSSQTEGSLENSLILDPQASGWDREERFTKAVRALDLDVRSAYSHGVAAKHLPHKEIGETRNHFESHDIDGDQKKDGEWPKVAIFRI